MTSPLPSTSYPEERRLATVLFADIIGFTTLAERLDFEDLTHLVREVWLRVDTIIEEFGGYVDKHTGDAVMAVWGAPFAGENDAAQAVRAGLALQRELVRFSQTSPIPGAINLKLRVGINTGMVLAGYVGKRREYTVMGDTVNIASRLQNYADPETVIISESTHHHLRGAFAFHRVEQMMVLKGRTEPVQAYLVTGVITQPGRLRYQSVDNLETCMVGREPEMGRLNELYRNAVDHQTPSLALVIGESGLGKSRLLMEFASLVESSTGALPADLPPRLAPPVLSGRALAQTSHVPFSLWKSIWATCFNLDENEPLECQAAQFEREIQRIWSAPEGETSPLETAHILSSLIGLPCPENPFLARFADDPQARLLRAYALTRELLSRMADRQPLMLVLDDLHHVDQASLDLIADLLDPARPPLALFILSAARPDFAYRSPRWLNLATVVELKPLPMTPETVSKAYPILRNLPEPALTRLAELSDGNPYFMEEMVKGLLKSELVLEEAQTEAIIDQVQSHPPESLRVMLQARLDALPHEARSVALLASVVGRVFWVGAVLAAARVANRPGSRPLIDAPVDVVKRLVQVALRQLVRDELAFPRANSTYNEEQEYIFKHSLLREVAYGLLPHRVLPSYHQAVGEWLEGRGSHEYRLMASEHFELAGAFGRAAQCLEEAAGQAVLRGAEQEAQEMLGHARTLRARGEPHNAAALHLDPA